MNRMVGYGWKGDEKGDEKSDEGDWRIMRIVRIMGGGGG